MSELTPVELETMLDRVLRGDQGAAQQLIDHNKALWEQLAAMTHELNDAIALRYSSDEQLAAMKQELNEARASKSCRRSRVTAQEQP